MSQLPLYFNKREKNMARRMVTLLIKFGFEFDEGTRQDAANDLMDTWDSCFPDHFDIPSHNMTEYKMWTKELRRKRGWHLTPDSVAQMMLAHNLAARGK